MLYKERVDGIYAPSRYLGKYLQYLQYIVHQKLGLESMSVL